MPHYKLRKISFFQHENSLFITNEHHNLVEIPYGHLNCIATIIELLEIPSDGETLFSEVEKVFEGNRSLFDTVMEWLVLNDLVERTDDEFSEPFLFEEPYEEIYRVAAL